MITMKPAENTIRKFMVAIAVISFVTFSLASISCAAGNLMRGQISITPEQKTFLSPEEAVLAFVAALTKNDDKELVEIFGSGGKQLVISGDPVDDQEQRSRFLRLYQERNSLIAQGTDRIILVGKEDYPFPVPLVKKADSWRFDSTKGREEILCRRIGANELHTIQTMLAIVDAQREYAMKDRDNDGLLAYADKFESDAGTHNGLYWKTKQGEQPSPLGELVAKARAEGYRKGKSEKSSPYHGYVFRILKKQGSHADGGGYDYVVKGRMIGGFAVVAYPAKYRSSGVMTFIVNHDGVVYQKDLGPATAKIAHQISMFDPGSGWKKVEESATLQPAPETAK